MIFVPVHVVWPGNAKKDGLTTDAAGMRAESADMDSSADSSDSDTDYATEGFDKESALQGMQGLEVDRSTTLLA